MSENVIDISFGDNKDKEKFELKIDDRVFTIFLSNPRVTIKEAINENNDVDYNKIVARWIYNGIIEEQKGLTSIERINAQNDDFFNDIFNRFLQKNERWSYHYNNLSNDNYKARFILAFMRYEIEQFSVSIATSEPFKAAMQSFAKMTVNIVKAWNENAPIINSVLDKVRASLKSISSIATNFLNNLTIPTLSEERKQELIAYIYGNEEKLKIAGDLGEEMYGERFKKDLSDYAKSKDKSEDGLTEQESEKQLNLFSDSLNLDLISAMVSGQRISELTEAVNENLAHEDFNEMKNPNFRAKDFSRKWNHTDTKHPTYPDDIANKMLHLRTPKTDEAAIANISVQEFLSKLDDTDRKILDLLQKGYTQKEIANELGFESNSAVSKRIAKLRLTRVEPVTPDK